MIYKSSFDLVAVELGTTGLGALALSGRLCTPSAIPSGVTQGQALGVVLDIAATIPSQVYESPYLQGPQRLHPLHPLEGKQE